MNWYAFAFVLNEKAETSFKEAHDKLMQRYGPYDPLRQGGLNSSCDLFLTAALHCAGLNKYSTFQGVHGYRDKQIWPPNDVRYLAKVLKKSDTWISLESMIKKNRLWPFQGTKEEMKYLKASQFFIECCKKNDLGIRFIT